MKFRILVLVIFAFALSGCAGNSFKEARKNEPHASLTFEKYTEGALAAMGGNRVYPVEINGIPPSDFKLSRDFRIPPGKTLILAHSTGSLITVYSSFLEFDAKESESYDVRIRYYPKYVRFMVVDSSGEVIDESNVAKAANYKANK